MTIDVQTNCQELTLEHSEFLIKDLRSFIGADRLKRRIDEFGKLTSTAGDITIYRVREGQPLLDAFRHYRRLTLGGHRKLKVLDENIACLAELGLLASMVTKNLDDGAKRHHIDGLISLSGRHRPTVLEWKTAAFYVAALGADIKWNPPSKPGPEFVATCDGLEWEVECKCLTPNISELLRQNESDELASSLARVVHSAGFCGTLKVSVKDDLKRSGCIERISERVSASVKVGHINMDVDEGVQIEGALEDREGRYLTAELVEGLRNGGEEFRSYLFAPNINKKPIDPLIIRIQGERRRGAALLDYLWDQRFNRAARQCTGQRGAVLVFEWSELDSVEVFESSEGIKALVERTFEEHRHVSSIVMRGAPRSTVGRSKIHIYTPAYLFNSTVTKFPEIAALRHLDVSTENK